MENLGAFELEVLGFLCDDYEAPHTITGDIARELNRPLSEPEVGAALLALAKRGFAQAYVYDPEAQQLQTDLFF